MVINNYRELNLLEKHEAENSCKNTFLAFLILLKKVLEIKKYFKIITIINK